MNVQHSKERQVTHTQKGGSKHLKRGICSLQPPWRGSAARWNCYPLALIRRTLCRVAGCEVVAGWKMEPETSVEKLFKEDFPLLCLFTREIRRVLASSCL